MADESTVDDDLVFNPRVDSPYPRWAVLVTYPAGHHHRYAGTTLRIRGDGSRQMAERRRDWHQANGGTAVLQRQTWTPTPWEDVPEVTA